MIKILLSVIMFICVTVFPSAAFAGTQTDPQLSVRLPVLMYHSVLNSKKGRYIVSEAQLDSDLAALKENGYTAVSEKEVIAYAEGKALLPDKPVLITFDDGHYNNLYYALPLLEKYGMRALFNIVGSYSEYSTTSGDKDNPNYSHLTWDEIGNLYKGGRVTFGAHSYNMHRFKPRYGIGRMSGESEEAYKKALVLDTSQLNEKLYGVCGEYPVVYAYPFGKYSDVSREILQSIGFKMFLTCNEGVSVVTFNKPESLYCVKRINREGRYLTSQLLRLIAQ